VQFFFLIWKKAREGVNTNFEKMSANGAAGGGITPLSATELVFLGEKKILNVLKRKHMYF